MSDFERRVVIIPARPQAIQEELKRQKRVAAYCRVSTEEEEQQSSYEAQCSYYTDKIMTNPEWAILQSSKGGSFRRWTSSQAVPHVRIFLWPVPNGWDSPEKDPVCLWSKSESLRR